MHTLTLLAILNAAWIIHIMPYHVFVAIMIPWFFLACIAAILGITYFAAIKMAFGKG